MQGQGAQVFCLCGVGADFDETRLAVIDDDAECVGEVFRRLEPCGQVEAAGELLHGRDAVEGVGFYLVFLDVAAHGIPTLAEDAQEVGLEIDGACGNRACVWEIVEAHYV